MNRIFAGFLLYSLSLLSIAWTLNFNQKTWGAAAILISILLFLFIANSATLRLIEGRFLLQSTLILAALSLIIPPRHNNQMERILWDGYIQTEGENPYFEFPSSVYYSKYQATAFYESVQDQDQPTRLSPAEAIITRLGFLAVNNPLNASFVIKFLAVIIFGLGSWLLIQIVEKRNQSELVFLLWNPGVLVALLAHGIQAGIPILLFAAALYARNREIPDMELALAGALANLNPALMLFPAQKRYRDLGLVGFGIFAASVVVWWLPFMGFDHALRYFLSNTLAINQGLLAPIFGLIGLGPSPRWLLALGVLICTGCWFLIKTLFTEFQHQIISLLLIYSVLCTAFFPLGTVLFCLFVMIYGRPDERHSMRQIILAALPLSLMFLK